VLVAAAGPWRRLVGGVGAGTPAGPAAAVRGCRALVAGAVGRRLTRPGRLLVAVRREAGVRLPRVGGVEEGGVGVRAAWVGSGACFCHAGDFCSAFSLSSRRGRRLAKRG